MAIPTDTITVTANLSDLSQDLSVNGVSVSTTHVVSTAILAGPQGAPGKDGTLNGASGVYLTDANGILWLVTVGTNGALDTEMSTVSGGFGLFLMQ